MARILVVEDTPETLELMQDWLALRQHEVLTASRGAEAIQIAQTERPDLILLDSTLPDMGGVQSCQRLRGGGQTAPIPVILIAGQDMPDVRFARLQSGASAVVSKPVVLNELGILMETLLEGRQPPDLGDRWPDEAVLNIVHLLPINLAWLLIPDPEGWALISRAIATPWGKEVADDFLEAAISGQNAIAFSMKAEAGSLADCLFGGVASFNLSLAELEERCHLDLHPFAQALDLGFVSVIPLQVKSASPGVLLLGGAARLDTESLPGQQGLTAAIDQMVIALDGAYQRQRVATYAHERARSNTRLFREAQSRIQELTLLLEISEAGSSGPAIEQVLEMVASRLVEALSIHWCMVSIWEQGTQSLITLAEVADLSWPPERGRKVNLADPTPTRQAVETGRAFATSTADPDLEPDRRKRAAICGLHALLALPILFDDRVVGLVELYHASADHISSASDIEDCQAIIETWHRSLEPEAFWIAPANLRRLSQALLQATDAAWCTILSFQSDEGTLTVLLERGKIIWPLNRGRREHLEENCLRYKALVERHTIMSQVDDPQLQPSDHLALREIDTGALMIVPLLARGETIGLVQVANIKPGYCFTESALTLAQTIANVVGNALENTRLYSTLARRATQLEAAYDDLREADRIKDELIRNVGHEMRTPLTAIMGYADLLGDLGALTDEQRQAIDVIAKKSEQLARLVDSILTVQQMEQEPLQREWISLGDIAHHVIKTRRWQAKEAGIRVELDIPGDLPEICVDQARVFQALDNLLDNAIKFSPRDGYVGIRMWDAGAFLQVEVADEGIGIEDKEQEKIWRRFYQVDGSVTRQYGGMGLGLAIVKQIVELHGGQVRVRSKPGVGSIFAFSIPKVELLVDGEAEISVT